MPQFFSHAFAFLVSCTLAASDAGPFTIQQRLYDGTPATICRDGTIESATLMNGNSVQGTINCESWAGDRASGTGGALGGINLKGPVGKNYYVGLTPNWETREGIDAFGSFVYYRRFQQDQKMLLGFVDISANALPTKVNLDEILPNARLVAVLPWRWLQGGGSSYQNTYYSGVILQAGVWSIPAGMSLAMAQQNQANRLSNLGILDELRPDVHGTSWKMQIETEGRWSLSIDIGNNGIVDANISSENIGNRRNPFVNMTEASGLRISTFAAQGVGSGRVGRSQTTLYFRESPTGIASSPMNRRPFSGDIPVYSVVSPVQIRGKLWAPAFTATASSSKNPSGVGTPQKYGVDVYTSLKLLPAGTPVDITIRQSGSPTTDVTGTVYWKNTEIYNGGTVFIRKGDSLLFTYSPSCGSDYVTIDTNGDGIIEFSGDSLQGFPYQFINEGVYTVRGNLNGPTQASHVMTVKVAAVNFDGPIACEIGYQREKGVELSGVQASDIFFTANDPSLLSVGVKELTPYGVRLYLKPLKRGTPVVIARLGSSTGPIISQCEIDEFTFDRTINNDLITNGKNFKTEAEVRIVPLVNNIDLSFTMFANRASFETGALHRVSTTSFIPFTDPATGLLSGYYRYNILIPPNENVFCYRTSIDQRSKYGTLVAKIFETNGSTTTYEVDLLKVCDGQYHNEVLPVKCTKKPNNDVTHTIQIKEREKNFQYQFPKLLDQSKVQTGYGILQSLKYLGQNPINMKWKYLMLLVVLALISGNNIG